MISENAWTTSSPGYDVVGGEQRRGCALMKSAPGRLHRHVLEGDMSNKQAPARAG